MIMGSIWCVLYVLLAMKYGSSCFYFTQCPNVLGIGIVICHKLFFIIIIFQISTGILSQLLRWSAVVQAGSHLLIFTSLLRFSQYSESNILNSSFLKAWFKMFFWNQILKQFYTLFMPFSFISSETRVTYAQSCVKMHTFHLTAHCADSKYWDPSAGIWISAL